MKVAGWATGAATILALLPPVSASAQPAVSGEDRMDAAVRVAAGLAKPAAGSKGKPTPLRTDGQGRVMVYVDGDDNAALRKAVSAAGGMVSDGQGGQVRAAVPPSNLDELASNPAVADVRRPDTPVPMDIVSEGAQPSGALAWHDSGRRGAGVKVGILDVGFGRLEATQAAGELPTDVTVSNGGCNPDAQSSHGTTMAEIVHDMAPEAQLFLACVTDTLDFDDAARWLKDQGVQVVNVAMGFPGTGRGNGLPDVNQADWSPATVVAWLRGQGILVVAAAGNEADKHMTGAISDPEGNGWVNISGAAENQGFTVATSGATVTVELRWDLWPKTTTDYDLYVMGALHKPTGLNDPDLVDYSIRPQQETAGGLPPVETVTFDNTTAGTAYWVYVKAKNPANGTRYDLTMFGRVQGLSFVNPSGSIAEPGSSPSALTVGAITPANAAAGTVESYSSQGPTIDGRVKPDVTGFTDVSTFTGGVAPNQTAAGTSVAAAHVTGAAALYKSANPGLDAGQLSSVLLDSSTRHQRSNVFGYGVLNVGSPRDPAPPPSSAFTPLAAPTRILDTTGSTGGHPGQLQAGETFTLRIPNLPADATAVMIDITTLQPAADTQLEVFGEAPTGIPTLYAEKGRFSSAFLTATLDLQDKVVRIKNSSSATNVQIDMYGYYTVQSSASTFFPKTRPYRLLDTRTWGIANPKLDAGEVQTLRVRSTAGVPSNATAVLLNVKATDATEPTHLELYADNPQDRRMLSPYTGEDLQTMAMVPVSDGGSIRIKNYTGSVHVAVDLVGWYATGGGGARYVPLRYAQPAFDTETGAYTVRNRLHTSGQRAFTFKTQPLVASSAVTAGMFRLTTKPYTSGATTTTDGAVWCEDCGWSAYTNVSNYRIAAPSAIRPMGNAAVVPVGSGGKIDVRNSLGDAQMSLTLYGYFIGGQPDDNAPLPAPTGWWTCDETSGTTVADSSGNGQTATLQGGTSRGIPGRIGRACTFDGTSGYADTGAPVLRTDQSFSVSAWVHLGRKDRNFAVASQDGQQASAFVLQYESATGRWAMRDPNNGTVASSPTPGLAGEWVHLVGMYSAEAHQLRLYVNGARAGEANGATLSLAGGPFAISRAKANGTNTSFFAGHVDDVRTYDRVLTDAEVRELYGKVPTVMFDNWKFDEGTGTTASDSTSRLNTATLTGGATWTTGVSGHALQLNGSPAAATTAFRSVPTTDSFSVAAWAKLDRTDQCQALLAQDGTVNSGFYLQFCPNTWQLAAAAADASSAPTVIARGPLGKLGQWSHVGGVYDAGARVFRLYVDGNLAGAVDGVTLWNATGVLTIGRSKRDSAPSDYFTGAIDDVRTYTGRLTDAQIRSLATSPTSAVSQLGSVR